MASQTNPHFLTLPGETRNNIYRKLFRNARIAAVGSISAKSLSKSRGLKAGLWKTYHNRKTIAILHTCSLVRAEAEPIFHDLVELHLDASDLWSILRRWSIVNPLPFAMFKIITVISLALQYHADHVVRMCGQIKTLKVITSNGHHTRVLSRQTTSWDALSKSKELREACFGRVLLRDHPISTCAMEAARRAAKELRASGRDDVKVVVSIELSLNSISWRPASLNLRDGVLRYVHEDQEINIK